MAQDTGLREPEHMHGQECTRIDGRTPAPLAGRSHLVWPAGGAAGWPGGPEGDGSLRPRVLGEDLRAGFVSVRGEVGAPGVYCRSGGHLSFRKGPPPS